jgi:hypothetical protein
MKQLLHLVVIIKTLSVMDKLIMSKLRLNFIMAHRKSIENFTIFNHGTAHSFNPSKKVIDQYTNKERTLLAIHMDKVVEANDTLVYILDNHGEELNRNAIAY